MFVHPSNCNIYPYTHELKEQLFIDLKDDKCYEEVVHDVEKDVFEVPDIEFESQNQSQGLGHSSKRAQLLAKLKYIRSQGKALRLSVRDFKARLRDEFHMYSLEQPCDLPVNPYDW